MVSSKSEQEKNNVERANVRYTHTQTHFDIKMHKQKRKTEREADAGLNV